MVGQLMNNELTMVEKKAVVIKIELLSQRLLGHKGEYNESRQSE
jgi:hypothetical protein